MNLRNTLASALALTLLAACGGGGGNDNDTPAAGSDRRVPASALASASAYSEWAGTLVSSETESAVTVDDGLLAPKSETDTPIALR